MSELVDFLNRCLNERERVALAEQHQESGVTELETCPGARSEPVGDLPAGEEHCWCGLAERRAATLADIAAKRAILAIHKEARYTNADLGIRDAAVCITCHAVMDEPDGWPEDRDWSYPLVQVPYPCPTIRALASAGAREPGYRDEWGPS